MKAVITDLDRTLLRTDKTVSGYSVDILRECRKQGILVMVASARPLRDIRTFDELIGFDGICSTNGAVVSLPQSKREFSIPPDVGEKILSRIMKYPDVFLSAETSNGLYSNRDIPIWSPTVYDGFPKLPENIALYKILASSKCRELYEGITDTLADGVYHTVANNELIQIMSAKASKWNGIKYMLSYYNVSPKQAVFFGDDNDDIESIENCGLGVAVSNAIPTAISAADRVTSSNDRDGVAHFIAENILL